MTRERPTRFALLIPALLLAIAIIACGSPDDGPAVTSTPEIPRRLTTDLDEFNGWLVQAVADRDAEAMTTIMSNPFEITVFQAGGSTRPPDVASEQMNSLYPPAEVVVECGEEAPDDVFRILGTSRADYFALSYSVTFCTGWGPDGVGEALLLINLDDDGFLYWTEIYVALNGFAGASR